MPDAVQRKAGYSKTPDALLSTAIEFHGHVYVARACIACDTRVVGVAWCPVPLHLLLSPCRFLRGAFLRVGPANVVCGCRGQNG